ncbi:MAG: hypothetical protein FWJ70_11785 [Micromonosporaceae bacterium]
MLTYVAPAVETDAHVEEDAGVPAFVATIAVILAFFGSVAAWCWFVCRDYGGLQSCEVGWFEAKAVCKG